MWTVPKVNGPGSARFSALREYKTGRMYMNWTVDRASVRSVLSAIFETNTAFIRLKSLQQLDCPLW